MYRKSNQSELTPEKFELPVAIELSPDNRWVIMSELIPWSDFESEYAQNFSEKMGAIAKPFRMALGALIIKEKLRISDRETVEQIKENPSRKERREAISKQLQYIKRNLDHIEKLTTWGAELSRLNPSKYK